MSSRYGCRAALGTSGAMWHDLASDQQTRRRVNMSAEEVLRDG